LESKRIWKFGIHIWNLRQFGNLEFIFGIKENLEIWNSYLESRGNLEIWNSYLESEAIWKILNSYLEFETIWKFGIHIWN